MRKLILLFSIVCIGLSGCAYSSVNCMRAKGEDIMVFGAWGYIHCVNSSVTFYRSMDTIAYIKDKDYPKIPPRPTVTEDGTDIVIGKSAAAITK